MYLNIECKRNVENVKFLFLLVYFAYGTVILLKGSLTVEFYRTKVDFGSKNQIYTAILTRVEQVFCHNSSTIGLNRNNWVFLDTQISALSS